MNALSGLVKAGLNCVSVDCPGGSRWVSAIDDGSSQVTNPVCDQVSLGISVRYTTVVIIPHRRRTVLLAAIQDDSFFTSNPAEYGLA